MSAIKIDLNDIKRRAANAQRESERLNRLAMDIEFDQGLLPEGVAKVYGGNGNGTSHTLSWTAQASELNPKSLRPEDNMPKVKRRKKTSTSWARASAANIAELMRGRPMSGVTWLTEQLREKQIRASEGMVEKILNANPDIFQKRGRYTWGLVTPKS